jgi:hypothetical protein
MRLSKEALSVRVVVRRTRRGATPFVWEINRDSMVEPVYVSPEGFFSMEAAYMAGKARLAEFIPAPGSVRESPLWYMEETALMNHESPHEDTGVQASR